MQDETVFYQGRVVLKQGFRAYVYGLNDLKKLANSWDEFQKLISSGLWYAKLEDANKQNAEMEVVDDIKKFNKKNKHKNKGHG